MESTERYTLVMHQYAETFHVSEKQRAKFYRLNEKLPKRMQARLDAKELEYRTHLGTGKIFLYNSKEHCFIDKNIKNTGKPKISSINSQIFWESGSGGEWTRVKIKAVLNAMFEPMVKEQLPVSIVPEKGTFLQLEYIFWYPFGIRRSTGTPYQDYINHFYVRGKVFEDVLTKMKVIKDDNPDILRGAYARYVNVETEEERRLEIKIHFCKNEQRIY